MVIEPSVSAHVALHSRACSVGEDEFSEGRQVFLEACRSRRSQPPTAPGPEESVAGCGCFLRLSDRPGASAVYYCWLSGIGGGTPASGPSYCRYRMAACTASMVLFSPPPPSPSSLRP